MNNETKLRIGITQGDTNGIGLEVVIKALSDPAILELMTPVIYGSNKIMSFHRKAMDLPGFTVNMMRRDEEPHEGVVNVCDCVTGEVKIELGQADKQAGRAAFEALERAVADLKANRIDALVTAPINKDNIQSEQFTFTGHTDYLESSTGEGNHAMMVLVAGSLRVALATVHLPLARVPQAITVDGLTEHLRTFNMTLRRDFGVERPRIAVLALNPHAGENGLLGDEERNIIIPAIEAVRAQDRITCFGPYPADGFFGNHLHEHFDGVLAMYHDQGLLPFKTLAMDEGVNYTAGLPVVRTSPDHGTGYDIAGKGVAREQSMRNAIYAAIDIVRRRRNWDEAHANPLTKQYHERGRDNVVLDLTATDDQP